MSVSLAYLQRCASDTGFQVGALEKVVRLGEFAACVNITAPSGRGTDTSVALTPPWH